MLFHVEVRHDVAECPGFSPEMREKTLAAFMNLDATAEKFGVKVHGMYNALPDHVEFLVCEADNPAMLAMFLGEMTPYRTDTTTHAVVSLDEMKEMAAALMP